jgi:NB-ARC domain
MDVSEVVNIADRLVFQSRNKHLNDLERSIVEGVSEGKTSVQIANETREPPYTEAHVNEVAANLWKNLSVFLGEKVTKKNLKSTIERYHSSIIIKSHSSKISNISLCLDAQKSSKGDDLISDSSIAFPPHPKNMPLLVPIYGRSEELNILKKWVLEDRCKSIVIYGTYGIGKTALARQLIEEIGDKFKIISWQSLCCNRSLVEFTDRNLLPDLRVDKLPESPLDMEARLSLLIEYLREHRCLIILDDVEEIFSAAELAGNYADKYSDYRELFNRIRETNHQSCLVQISCEKPSDVEILEEDNCSVRTLRLDGISTAGREIFRTKGLVDEDRWKEAISSYGGNPQYLEIVATSVKKSFGGKVDCICGLDQIFVNAQLRVILTRQFERLSKLEKEVIVAFARQQKAVSILEIIVDVASPLGAGMQISLADGCDATESLMRRGLIFSVETDNGMVFNVDSIFKQFVLTVSA